jgi:hypothetical protein
LRDLRERLIPLEEPLQPRAETRALIEGDPEEGLRFVDGGQPLADLLWDEWGAELEGAGMDRERFYEITRGYSGEIWLWAMGERPWEHCVAGLAGRVVRRLPRRREEQQELAGTAEACR